MGGRWQWDRPVQDRNCRSMMAEMLRDEIRQAIKCAFESVSQYTN